MKLSVGLLPLVVVAARPFFAAPSIQPQVAKSLAEAESAVVQLVTVHRGGAGARVPHGSAFYVGDGGRLLTCAHVLDHMPKEDTPRLRLRDGTEKPFQVVQLDREVDLALLQSDPPEWFVALSDAPLPAVGRRAVFIGFTRRADDPAGVPPMLLKRGTVVAVERRRAARARRAIVNIKVDEIADPGQSGGPLLAEESLAVIGIMRANLESATGGIGRVKPEGYGVAVPLMYVKPFIAQTSTSIQ